MNSATINGKDFASVTYPCGKKVLKLVKPVFKEGYFCLDGYKFPHGSTINLNGIPYKLDAEMTRKKFQVNNVKYVSWYLRKLEF